jgi:prepilin peptidase CpaA
METWKAEMGELILNLVVLIAVAVATFTDLRSRRIPNVLTVPAAAIGLGMNGVLAGPDGLLTSLGGWALGVAILLPLFALRGMGAGDVKLIAALGALKGPEFVFFTCLWAGVAGGVMAVAGLVRSGTLSLALANLYHHRILPRPDNSVITAWRLPYAPAIALGAVAVLGGVRWFG